MNLPNLPITHFLYLAFVLFTIGLAGVLLRRSLLAVLGGVQIMIGAVVLILVAYARYHGDLAGQASAGIVALVGLLELALAAALVVRAQTGASHDWLADWTVEPTPGDDE